MGMGRLEVRMKRVMPFVVLCLLAAMATAAHGQILTGRIIGSIKDDSGGILPGVSVVLTSATALPGGSKTVVTDDKGEYRFTELTPGTYTLGATLQGFNAYKEDGLQ